MDEGANPFAEDVALCQAAHDTFSPLPLISELRRLTRWLLAVRLCYSSRGVRPDTPLAYNALK